MFTFSKVKMIVSLSLALTVFCANAQKGYFWEFGAMTGVSNYLGEIGGRDKAARPFIFDVKLQKTRWNESIYVRYRLARAFAVKASLNYLRIEGSDALTYYAPRHYRNLSFRNDIYSLETTINWYIFTSDRPSGIYARTSTYFTAYILAGVGAFYHNPKTLYQGSWIALQPLKTENVSYSKVAVCVPLGVGFFVTLNQRRRAHRIGLEVCWRYTTTDYLDDVSGSYPNPATLGSKDAVNLSNRNPELTSQPDGYNKNYGWWDDGSGNNLNKAPRGNKNDKDSYFSVNVTYGMAIKSRYTRRSSRRIRSVSF